MVDLHFVPPTNYEMFSKVIQKFNPAFTLGCEVGVRDGVFTEYLLINNPRLNMVCVDSYEPYMDITHHWSQEAQDEVKFKANAKLSYFGSRVRKSVKPSIIAAKEFNDSFFGFVYIDACHEYESVVQDIEAWIPKVMKGGLIAGHDWSMSGVQKAVKELVVKKHNIEVFISPADQGDNWWGLV